jgi:hypothetical protein
LTYEEKEEVVEAEPQKRGDMEIGLKTLIKKYGLKRVMDTIARVSKE